MVLPAERRGLRILHIGRPVYNVHVLRGRAHTDVPSYRSMGDGPQGIFGDEADSDADGRFGLDTHRYPRHLFRVRSDHDEYSRDCTAAQYPCRDAEGMVPYSVCRVRSAGCPVSVPYVEPGWPRIRPYRRIDAARRCTYEARRLRLLQDSDVPPSGCGPGAQLDIHCPHDHIGCLRSLLRLRPDRP